jgi:hypothetical protein
MGKDWAGKGRPLQGPGAGRAKKMPGQYSEKKGCGKSLIGFMVIIGLALFLLADCAW